jgi:superfamily II helicase
MENDRAELAMQVLQGKADPELLSWEEIEELEQVVGQLAMTKTMEQRMDHGSIVFEEVDTLQ